MTTAANTAEVLMPNGSIQIAPMVANDGMFSWLHPKWPEIKGYKISAGAFYGNDAAGNYVRVDWRAEPAA